MDQMELLNVNLRLRWLLIKKKITRLLLMMTFCLLVDFLCSNMERRRKKLKLRSLKERSLMKGKENSCFKLRFLILRGELRCLKRISVKLKSLGIMNRSKR